MAMIHVYPVNDLKEHELEGVHCSCEPTIDWKLGIVTHNAFDMREIEEFVKGAWGNGK